MQPNIIDTFENRNYRVEILRYLSFWPYLLILLLLFIFSSFLYLRYATFKYESMSVIQMIDEAMDSEMALPSELTIFNRSMINLENEVTILKSFSLHENVVKKLKSNVIYIKEGKIKSTETTQDDWFEDFQLKFNINTDTVKHIHNYEIEISKNKLYINSNLGESDETKSYSFDNLTTTSAKHNLPFDLTINNDSEEKLARNLKIIPTKHKANEFRSNLTVSSLGKDSDQLQIKLVYPNVEIGEKYLENLLFEFDNDGIDDRQLEYKRTIEFVDTREVILKSELEVIELRKQNFKQKNNLSDLSLDAGNNIDLKFTYNSELFISESQKTIANYLSETINYNEYEYLPINIGLENFDLNAIIIEYNKIISERNRFISESGPNNVLVQSIENQLDNLKSNIVKSINNYLNSLEIKIENLTAKESEFQNIYNNVPENEKILRSIERELSIKEALYLLLLQKREEASINLAVVKPTIKIIDYPLSSGIPVSPRANVTYFSAILLALFIYYALIYLWFLLDNKIHNKEQLTQILDPKLPIIAEVPFIRKKEETQKLPNSYSRGVLSESVRMLISNMQYVEKSLDINDDNKSILFTSSIKGEGKTIISVNTAAILSNELKKKVILVGADLRNPQIHKFFNVDKNLRGVSDILYNSDLEKYKSYINRFDNLDVLFSGNIPPNPTSLLASELFKKLYEILKNDYDYIIIDSAPCLLVSDTFQILDNVDSVVYIFRANYTNKKIVSYINEILNTKNLKSLSIVLNSVGNSAEFGYKYGYQYGYKYGYNYGYGYGYSANKST